MEKVTRFLLIALLGQLMVGCEDTEPLQFYPDYPGIATIGADTSMCSYSSGSLLAIIDFERIGVVKDDLDSIVWTGGTINFINDSDTARLSEQDAGTFHLLFYDFPEVDTLTIHIYLCTYSLNIPSAFTPNGDDINDDWRPFGQVYDLYWEIRSPHGEFIFNSDMGDGWDGTWDGKSVRSGYYIYRIEYTIPPDQERKHTQGWLELYR